MDRRRLTEILLLEQRNGCDNRVVIGGLGELVRRELETPGAAGTGLTSGLESLRAYDSLTPAKRARLIAACLLQLTGSDESKTVAPITGPLPSPTEVTDVVRKTRRQALKSSSKQSAKGPTAATKPAQALATVKDSASLDGPTTALPGIKAASATKLTKLGINSVRDMLYHFPRRYSEVRLIRDLVPDQVQTIVASVWKARKSPMRGGLTIINLILADGTGTVLATTFRAGRYAWAVDYKEGDELLVTGTVENDAGNLVIKPTEMQTLGKASSYSAGQLLPVYSLTRDVRQQWLRSRIADTVRIWLSKLNDPLPDWVREQFDLPGLIPAVREVHAPSGWSQLRIAQRRLAFEELLLIQLGLLQRRMLYQAEGRAPVIKANHPVHQQLLAALPYKLTGGQITSAAEVVEDLGSRRPMMRLLQGEVGSGKTVVAFIAAVQAIAAGYQVVLMAPTEILASQHLITIRRLAEQLGEVNRESGGKRPIVIGYLSGTVKAAERRQLISRLGSGEIDLLLGTHALIEPQVQFARLGLVIVDEQHRFGVEQRAQLRDKGDNPHMLAMTATPIPRTMALTVYGDLDISVIGELPPGRQQVATRTLGPEERERAYAFVRKRILAGEQAFIICPLIEESDTLEVKAATTEFERLQSEVFPEFKLGLLHGRMRAKEKDEAMQAFRNNETNILVSTAVVEVGVDVPNATVMMIEGADRFGLAQLHQFRGRVGRGEAKAYCILLSESRSVEARERLAVLERTHDGFALAEEDLRLRGPGEFLGQRQSGLPDLRIARLSDVLTMNEARRAATSILERDLELVAAENRLLRERLAQFWDSAAPAD